MPFQITELLAKSRQPESYQDEFALDILKGLSEVPKRIPSKYFYDDAGSELFKKIMKTGDYYLSDSETDILRLHATDFHKFTQAQQLNIIDLGAGDGSKTMLMIKAYQEQDIRTDYYPIDISQGALESLKENLSNISPETKVNGLVADYFDGIRWLSSKNRFKNLVLFMGSNLGNFDRKESLTFLHHLWEALNPDDWIYVGFDLKKKIEILNKAYNDSEGLTQAFNLNLLKRINEELGGNFNLEQFSHYGCYDPDHGAMVSYLISQCSQEVFIKKLKRSFPFKAFEPVHVEFSYKYLPEEIESLGKETGFEVKNFFYDSKKWFGSTLMQVKKQLS